jgi:hypothetical protein
MTKLAFDTILAHPTLAGLTLMVRRDGRWAAHVIQPGGSLGDPRVLDADPVPEAWRAGAAA